MLFQSGQRRDLTDHFFEFFSFWFYLLALDVKLILIIIDNLLVKYQKCVQAGRQVRWPFVNTLQKKTVDKKGGT